MLPSTLALLRLAPILAFASMQTGLSALQAPTAGFDHSYARWTEVLQGCVRDGGFDYAKLKQERSSLDAVLATLQAVTPDDLAGWNEKQRFAFWINAYNAFCIQKVIDNYPLKSIRRLSGAFGLNSVFDKGFIPMKAHHPDKKDDVLSLNDIEHKILRRQFKDARLHAAINCASKSCPPLRNEAFTAAELEAQLDEQMRAFVNDPARNRIDPGKKELALSEIFKWFAEDFERDARSVKEYLLRFASPDKAELIRTAKIGYLDYDWDLNDVPKN
jgi:hypothetical protein